MSSVLHADVTERTRDLFNHLMDMMRHLTNESVPTWWMAIKPEPDGTFLLNEKQVLRMQKHVAKIIHKGSSATLQQPIYTELSESFHKIGTKEFTLFEKKNRKYILVKGRRIYMD